MQKEMAGVERFELPTRGFGKPHTPLINQIVRNVKIYQAIITYRNVFFDRYPIKL